MSEMKSWRDYLKSAATGEENTSEETGTWRDLLSGNSTTSNQSSGGWRDQLRSSATSVAANEITSRVNTWLQNHNNYISSYQNRYSSRKYTYDDPYVSDSASWLDTITKQKSEYDAEADSILSYMDQYSDYLDEDWMKSVREKLTSARGTQSQIIEASTKDNEYWSSFGSEDLLKEYGTAEDAYKTHQRYDGYSKKYDGKTSEELYEIIDSMDDGEEKKWLSSKAYSVDRDEKSSMDIEQSEQEIADLEELLFESYSIGLWYDAYSRGLEPYDAHKMEVYNNLMNEYGGDVNALKAYVSNKKARTNQARYIQKGNKLAGVGNAESENYDPEFSQYSGYVAGGKLPLIPDYEDIVYGFINGDQESKNGVSMATAWSKLSDSEKSRLDAVEQMTPEEKSTYNYYYNKHGYKAAEEYLDTIKETLDGRIAEKMYAPLKGHTVLEQVFGIAAGLDQFTSGVTNLFSDDDYIPVSATQQTSAMVREDLGDNGFKLPKWMGGGSSAQGVYDLITTTTNMVPSILVSTAVGMLNPTAGAITGATLMGASSAGSAYQEAVNLGYDKSQARAYSTLVGASEAGLQYLMGGIGKLGSQMSGKAATSLASKFNSAYARLAVKYGTNMLSEGAEEYLQEILTPVFKNLAFGTDEEVNLISEDAIYSFILGALSSGGMEITGISSDDGKSLIHHLIDMSSRNEENIKAATKYGGVQAELIEEGLLSPTDSESYQLAEMFSRKADKGKSMTGYEMRQLVEANHKQFVVEAYDEALPLAKQRLTELGETENVEEIAKLIAKRASGQTLTKREKSTLVRSRFGAKVAKEMTPDSPLQVYKSLDKRIGTEGRFGVSESGVATDRSTGNAIDLGKAEVVDFVTDEETGEVMDIVFNADGQNVNASDIDFADADQSYMVTAIAGIEHITPAAATTMIREVVDTSKPLGKQLNGLDEAFTYGNRGYSEADLKAGNFTPDLTAEQMQRAYKLGQEAAKAKGVGKAEGFKRMRTAAQAEAEKALAEGKTQEPKNLTITYNDGGKVVSIDEAGIKDDKREGAVKVSEFLHKLGLGTRVEFFSSYITKDEHGNRIRVFRDNHGNEQPAYSGIYLGADGTIRVDLNAYNGRGLALNALAHELTHFIQQWSAEKYTVLADFLIKSYDKTNMTMHERVIREQNRLEGIRGKEVSYDEAFDEVVANAMMKMFDDGKLAEKLTELKNKDKKLAQKLWEGFKEILAKFFDVYKKAGPLYQDTADIMAMKDTFEQLQNMFAEALMEASENYQAYLSVSESKTLTEAGIGFDVDTRSVYSLHFSTAVGDVKVGKKDFDAEAIAKLVSKATGRSIEDARRWVESEHTIANIVMQNPEFLDFVADDRYDAIKKNSDYPQGTVDMSYLCPKREEFTVMFDMLQRKYPDKLFTAQDVADMRKILSDAGITVACGACFVEDRRQLIGEIADTFIGMWKEAVETGKPLQKTNASGVKSDLLVTKALAKQYGLTPGAKILAADTYIPNQYDLTTYEGFKLLEKNHPLIAMAFNRYNNSRGQQSARLIEGRAEYKRQILGWSDAKVRSVNNNGGLRIFSFSDFEVVHLLDLVQVIIDCAAKGVKIQGYTKIPAFAKLVRNTGVKLNRSHIPSGEFGYHMENGKVVLDCDTTEGINTNDANFMDESDNPNVGDVIIGINPTQIGAAMLDPFFDYIIPFHSNKAKAILEKLGTGAWVNYKESQHEKDISTGKASKRNVNIYTEVINKYHPKNKVEFVNAFLKECKRQGKIPRYPEFLNVDENGDYVYREGYHKLLVDFKMFDKDGNILPQGNITPTLDDSFMTELLRAEVSKKQSYEFPQEVYDAIDKKFGERQSSQDTDLDSAGNQLSAEQQKFFKDSVVRDDNGKLLVVYHGTPNGSTTIFDKAKTSEINDMGQGIYFSTNKGDASTYMGKSRNKKLYSTYVNIKAPFVVSDNVKITVSEAASLLKLCDDRSLALDVYRGDVLVNAKDGYITTSQLANTNISQQMTKILEKSGKYDGIIDETVSVKFGIEEGTKHIIALNSNQIKLINNQNPTSNPDIRYSSQETDLDSGIDTAGEVNYDNENAVEQEDNTNETREESGEAFDRRTSQELFRVSQKGQLRYAYRPYLGTAISERAKGAEKELKKLGIPVFIYEKLETNSEGFTTNHEKDDSAAIPGVGVFVPFNAVLDSKEIAGHEAFHFLADSEHRTNYVSVLVDNIDFPSAGFISYYNNLKKRYFKKDVAAEIKEDDKKKDKKKSKTLSEEIFAYITGDIHNGDPNGEVHEFLRDYDAVKSAWDALLRKQSTGARFSSQETDADNAPTFYSQMGKVVEGMKQEKFGASSVISMLRGRGVKAEEIRWSGIQAFLDGKKSVTKQELLDFINSSMLHIEETILDGSKGEPVKLPNNYRLEETENGMGDPILNLYIDDELVDTFEQIYDGSISSTGDSDIWAMNEEDLTGQILSHYAGMSYDEAYGNGSKETKWDKYTLDGGENYRELIFKMPGAAYNNQAMEAHWGDHSFGVLAHARIQDFNTFIGRMLFIEEIQSDWHNAGQKLGYRKAGEKTAEQLRIESDRAYREFYGRVESMFNDHQSHCNPVLMANLFEGDADAINFVRRSGFTDEEMKYVKSAISEEAARKAALESAPSAGAVPDAPFRENYHEYVLKRLLRMAAEEGYDSIGWTTADIQSKRWSSEYAEGYRIEYDQDIPKFLRKYGRQWGAEVGKTNIDTRGVSEHEREMVELGIIDLVPHEDEVWYMPITEAMKKSVLKEGQAMYSSQETDADYIRYDRKAILKESKVDEYLNDYAAQSSPKYAQAYIAYVRPRTFLKLTTDDMLERLHIVDQAGQLDEERLSDSRPGIYLRIDHETGKVTGHEGRHRMAAMDGAGIELVPVLLLDNSNKMTKTDIEQIYLHGQFDETAMGIVSDLIPLNYENRDRVIKNFATQSSTQRIGERYGLNKTLRFSSHETDYSNRSLLANAFEGISQNSDEYAMIQDYRANIESLNAQEARLDELNAEIRRIRFGESGLKGKARTERLAELEAEAKEVAKEINKYDRKLLSMEASGPLRKVIAQERKKEAEKTKAHVKEIQKHRRDNAEQTEYRRKIRKVVRDLDKVLNRGDKKRNVKDDMKGFVSKALEIADFLFTDHISNDELIRRGITVRMTSREAALVKETEDILTRLYEDIGSLTAEEYEQLDAKRRSNMYKLSDLLIAQRNEWLNEPVYNLFNDLVTEYAALKNSSQDAVKAAYSPEVERFLRSYMGESDGATDTDRKTLLQNMRVADMSTKELEHLLYAYNMVLHTVRNANNLFVKGKQASVEEMAGRIAGDFRQRKIPDGKVAIVARNLANKLGWDYEKLHYALDRIGSEAFTELVMNLADSENTVMQDVIEAAEFRDKMVENYGFNDWDVNKEIDRDFLDNTGKKFRLTLGQLMALYAYSRRDGAWDHIEYGGFVFGEAALTNPKPADAYKLSKKQCEAITNLLTKEQKGYVEDMQKFLSEVMGGKGNEVSMLLYGIKMFGEKNYFPIKVAGQFKAQANESQAKAAAGFSTMSNAGFTHAQNPNAKAPFVLEGFNEVWADHVNEMSRYHGTVPALEDMRRVMNRSSYSESVAESVSIKQLMENAFGKEAVQYFDNLYREANSGAITDKLQKTPKWLLTLFRKNSVAYSASVWIQQPSAIKRAYALIDPKYFGYHGFGALTSGVVKAVSDKWTKAHTNAYNEMMQYAPGVTMAKEIGGFDTHTGGSIRSYLLDTGKSVKQKWKTGTALEKGKAVLDLVDDNAIANLPNVADKIAWIEIWNACKRETVATHKDLAPNSEEFMKIVGDRFTEVIRATQVYDSMFSKSPMLKSKNLAVQYLVSFMNEPNTTANMVEKAVRDAMKGDWKTGARTAGAVVSSIIFNNVLKSIIYAMRDDDEDETYIEKYIEALTSGMLSDFNPISYVPVAKDVMSAMQGYDVERPDMAIITDAIDAVQSAIKNATKDTENMTEAQLAEYESAAIDANWKLVGSIAAFFGIPVKNIYREAKGIIDHARIASENAGMTTSDSVWDKVYDAVIDSIPFMSSKKSKTNKLYDAIISGDKDYLDRIKSTYKDESAYQSAVSKALKENDSRIHDAAQARYDGKTDEYKRIFREIKDEGKFSFDTIMSAINSELSSIRKGSEPEKATSSYTATDFVESIVLGDTKSAEAIKVDIIAAKVANGKTQTDAEKEFVSSVSTGIRDAYSSGLLDKAGAEKMLMEYADKDEDEAASKVSYWSFIEDHPEFKDVLSEANVSDYYEFVEPADISLDVYAQFIEGTKGLKTIKDAWGDVEKSVRDQTLEVIDSLPLTWQQKDALYLAAGYSEDKIWDVPW